MTVLKGNQGGAMSRQLPARRTSNKVAVVGRPLPEDRNPVLVYLARLAPGSRPTMRDSLARIAEIVTGGSVSPETLDWSAMRYQHTAAIRSRLAERYAPATVNKMLAALRGVLREAWRLGQIP